MFSAIQKKTKGLLAAEEAQIEEEDDEDISQEQDQNNLDSDDVNEEESSSRPSKRARRHGLSMDDEELAYAKQFQSSSTFTNRDRNSVEDQEPGHEEDFEEEDERDNGDGNNLSFMDKNDDLETNIVFGGGELNGVRPLFYHIISPQFYFPSY